MNAPIVMSIDTATEVCSVALLAGGTVTSLSECVGQRHSERALQMVDEMLRAAGVALGDVDFVAYGAGPGSFTGLRVACGLAQGLAWGAGKRVIPVGNLRALASRLFVSEPDVSLVLCAIDARMHEAYCGVYQRAEDPIERLAPSLARAGDLGDLARAVDAVAGDALAVFPDAWAAAPTRRYPTARADAGDIARVAATPAGLARAVDPAAAAPLYVRDHVALTTAERRARAAA